MPRCPENVKKRLEEIGAWKDFCMYQNILSYFGWGANDAFEVAMKAFHPYCAGVREYVPGSTKVTQMLEKIPKPGQLDEDDIPKILRNKTAPIEEDMRWIYQNLNINNPSPRECPSQGAWSYMKRIQSDPQALKEFDRNILKFLADKDPNKGRSKKHDNLKVESMVESIITYNESLEEDEDDSGQVE